MIINFDDTRRHFIQALTDDVQALPHLLDAAQITVVTVTIFADGNIELNLDIRKMLYTRNGTYNGADLCVFVVWGDFS